MTQQNREAAEHYDDQRASALRLLNRIQMFVLRPDWARDADWQVNWGHVGSMADWTADLQNISDAMFHEGEYAD
jgi:hypothetical protein